MLRSFEPGGKKIADRALDADDIRRSLGRRVIAPLVAAGLIAGWQLAAERPGETGRRGGAAEPASGAPEFVRPAPRQLLMGARARVG